MQRVGTQPVTFERARKARAPELRIDEHQCLRQCTFIFDGRPGQCGTDVYDTDSRVSAVRQGLREYFRLGTRIVNTGRRFEEDRTDEQNAVGADRRSFRSAGPDEDPCCIGAVPCAQATLLTWLHGTARLGPMS